MVTKSILKNPKPIHYLKVFKEMREAMNGKQ